jgi:hypothetical protein
MKKIILQHWTGPTNELVTLSSANIGKYAESVGAHYKLLSGNVFHPNLSAPCQKLHMLNEEFDEYDTVVMLDPDMFTRKGMTENIFEVEGVGMFTEFQAKLFKQMQKQKPQFTNPNYPYWGGAIYKMDRDLRQTLRKHINLKEAVLFSGTGNFEDEGIVHRLVSLAKVKPKSLPGGFKWCHCSYREGIEKAAMIHIRTKITPQGPKRTKLENYNDLVTKGLIGK